MLGPISGFRGGMGGMGGMTAGIGHAVSQGIGDRVYNAIRPSQSLVQPPDGEGLFSGPARYSYLRGAYEHAMQQKQTGRYLWAAAGIGLGILVGLFLANKLTKGGGN